MSASRERLADLKSRAAAGAIDLVFLDGSEALTHPYLARCRARRRVAHRSPGQAKKQAMLGAFDPVRRRLLVPASPTRRATDFIAPLDQFGAVYGTTEHTRPLVAVLDNGPIHRSKLTTRAIAARPWLTIEWLPKYAPELTDPGSRPGQAIERCRRDLKPHQRANHTVANPGARDPPPLTPSPEPRATTPSIAHSPTACLLDERSEQLMAVATEQGFPSYRAMGTIYRGWVKVNTGEVAEGISVLRGGLSDFRATGTEIRTSYYVALLAKATGIAGQVSEALTLLDDALSIAERMRERWFAAELNRHKGELLLRQGHPEATEAFYRKALSIAREQEAKLWELRAAASLARLHRNQGWRSEARDLLAPAYGWFTEGFDTADLKEAKALLGELT